MKYVTKLGAALLITLINFQLTTCLGQSTVFTYQGRVLDNGDVFTGAGQFQFALVTSTNTASQATATATNNSGFITSIGVTYGGNGYFTAPAVSVVGGGGLGATATAHVSGGILTSITVNTPGAGYLSTPAVVIAPPAPQILYTTYWSNDGTSVAGSEPTAAVSVTVTNGLFVVTLGDTTVANMAALNASLFSTPNLQLLIWFNDGVNGFAALNPPQNLTPTPYAVFANTASNLNGTLPAAQLSGTLANGNLPASPTFGGTVGAATFSGSGASLTSLNANNLASGTVPLARLGGITSNQLDAATWQLATNSNGGNAASLSGMSASNFWQTGGNNVAAGQFLGSTNFQPVEIWINKLRALRLEPTLNDINHSNIINVVGGSPANYIAPGTYGSVIAGGGAAYYYFSGSSNSISSDLSFIGSGVGNVIQGSSWSAIGSGEYNTIQASGVSFIGTGDENRILAAYGSFIGAGQDNGIGTNSQYSFIGGGQNNGMGTNSSNSFIGGGDDNRIFDTAFESFIGGGDLNYIETHAFDSVLGGGFNNLISPYSQYAFVGGGEGNTIYSNSLGATIPGGYYNIVNGNYSFAAGHYAYATNTGTFVWADSQSSSFGSTASDQFLVRAQGGVGINTNAPPAGGLAVSGKISSPMWKATSVINGAGPLTKTGSFNSSGGTLIIFASGSGYTSSGNTSIGMDIRVDGNTIDSSIVFANAAATHLAFVSKSTVTTAIGAGAHSVTLVAHSGTLSDITDNYCVTVQELPY